MTYFKFNLNHWKCIDPMIKKLRLKKSGVMEPVSIYLFIFLKKRKERKKALISYIKVSFVVHSRNESWQYLLCFLNYSHWDVLLVFLSGKKKKTKEMRVALLRFATIRLLAGIVMSRWCFLLACLLWRSVTKGKVENYDDLLIIACARVICARPINLSF